MKLRPVRFLKPDRSRIFTIVKLLIINTIAFVFQLLSPTSNNFYPDITNMQSKTYKLLEWFIIFIMIPVSFAIHYSIWVKLALGCIGFTYIIYVLLRGEKQKFKIASHLNWKCFWSQTLIKLFIIAILTSIFVWFTDREALFSVLINKPLKWVILLFVYSFFSVYPQELIYRTFYFKRYSDIISNPFLFVFINAILFSLAHIFFANVLVSTITFFGGVLFAITYLKTKSTLLVSIEHAIYGSWLFTVGMGAMLGFPT